jgi:endonuclease/exonuclease/phosphatase family metal-dependent hydrolase
VIIGGDFNMITYIHEKSLGTKYTIWLDMLNNFINDTKIIELIRGGSLFTWTNKQQNPIRSNLDKIFVSKSWDQHYLRNRVMTMTKVGSNLDRIFVSKSWDQHYLRTRVMTMTRVGSDHNPLILDNGEQVESGKKMFRMESAWLGNTKFKNHLLQRWPERNM